MKSRSLAIAKAIAGLRSGYVYDGAQQTVTVDAGRFLALLNADDNGEVPTVIDGFWQQCVEAGCVVVPMVAYTKYGDDGNTHDEDKLGIRFVAVAVDINAVGPDYWFGIDISNEGYESLYESPDDALNEFLAGKPTYLMVNNGDDTDSTAAPA